MRCNEHLKQSCDCGVGQDIKDGRCLSHDADPGVGARANLGPERPSGNASSKMRGLVMDLEAGRIPVLVRGSSLETSPVLGILH